MQLRSNESLPLAVSASALLPLGSGKSRTIMRTLLDHADVSSGSTCADLAALIDPLETPGLAGAWMPQVGAGGTRLQRQESTAVSASLWLARIDCPQMPLLHAVPLSPSLLFLSAYSLDARDVTLPAAPSSTVLSPIASPESHVPPLSYTDTVSTGVYSSLRGVLVHVTAVNWTVTGVPSADATALNETLYGGSLPLVHQLTWISSTLGSALPPYALLPGYYYTATASAALEAAWAWDTDAFESRVFPPTPPPSTAHVVAGLPESIFVAGEVAWVAAHSEASPSSPLTSPWGRAAALAYVTLSASAVMLSPSPSNGTALVTLFDVAASGGVVPSNSSAGDFTPSTSADAVNRIALVSAYPMPLEAAQALLAVASGSSSSAEAPVGDAQTALWCADLIALGLAAAPSPTVFRALPAWALSLGPLAHALAIARALDAAGSPPPFPSADLLQVEAVSATILDGSGGAAEFARSADLCTSITTQLAAVVASAPLNPAFDPAPRSPPPPTDVQYSFRVGTRPLSALPAGLLSATGRFSSPEAVIRAARIYSIPLQISSLGWTSFSSISQLYGLQLPLPMQWSGLNLSVPTLLPVYALSNDGSGALSAGVVEVALLPPIPQGNAGDGVAVSAAVSSIASGVNVMSAAAAPMATLLTIGTLGSILATTSTAVDATGLAVGANASSFTSSNTATRTLLITCARAALDALVLLSQNSGGAPSGQLLDDSTCHAIALAVLSISADPLELSISGATITIDLLYDMLAAAVAGLGRRRRELPSSVAAPVPLIQMNIQVSRFVVTALFT